jgi:hypothetical protein
MAQLCIAIAVCSVRGLMALHLSLTLSSDKERALRAKTVRMGNTQVVPSNRGLR